MNYLKKNYRKLIHPYIVVASGASESSGQKETPSKEGETQKEGEEAKPAENAKVMFELEKLMPGLFTVYIKF